VFRRRLRRHPVPYWLAAIALIALTVSTVAHVTDAAAAERARWGSLRPVLVAGRDLRPGDRVRGAHVRMVPAALVPRGALTHTTGATVVSWIGAGEVVLARRVTPAGLSATASRLPPGTRGIAVPVGQAPLPVEVGDRVDVVAAFDTDAVTIAVGAVVVAEDESAVTVAVDRDDAADVAYAVTAAAVTLVLSGAR
jgi:Flp pilus assembly protein CpaB